MGSFIGTRKRVWWVASDARSRQVVAMAVGDRNAFTARCLWEALPVGYRKRAIVAADSSPVYRSVVREGRHAPAGEEADLTAPVERFFCTPRQRCARFVRETLSFSRKRENHVGAPWYFVRLYNACRLPGHYR